MTWSAVASLVLHVALVGLGLLAYRALGSKEARDAEHRSVDGSPSAIVVEVSGVVDGMTMADRDVVPEGTLPSFYGGDAIARVDTGSSGAGGDRTGARATNLAASDDQMRFEMDPMSRLDRDQVQRLKTADHRSTRDDRRATTHPMELTFLATGKGERPEHRPDSTTDPSRGSMRSKRASVVGGQQGSRASEVESMESYDPVSTVGAERSGQLLGSPGVGVRDGKVGPVHRVEARAASARPSVSEASPTIPGALKGRPNDTIDSEQEVSSVLRNLVHASFAGGLPGEGRGGSGPSSFDPAAGGEAARGGSMARPLGTGDGELVDWNTSDPLLVPYFRTVHAKVDPLWAHAFPKSAMAELRQGTVIIEFSIAADGTASVRWPPIRPSGIDEFDRNCAEAIRRASPLPPIPAALKASGRTTLTIRAPFAANNPIIK